MTSSSSSSGLVKQLSDVPVPHVFETFNPTNDYEAYRKRVLIPLIRDSHVHHYVYHSDKPVLPLPVFFTPSRPSIDSVHKLILDTDINSHNRVPFNHYIDYPPRQSASIPIARRYTIYGYFSPRVPGCFVSDCRGAFWKGDIVALGQAAGRKVILDGIIEVGRHFILYEVHEIGLVPLNCVQITQLAGPLSSHSSVFLRFLALLLMAVFPCFFRSSAVFGEQSMVSGSDEDQSRFSDVSSMA